MLNQKPAYWKIAHYDVVIEVQHSDTGCYTITDAPEEDPRKVADNMNDMKDYGDLLGWEPWERVFQAVDDDGRDRWYFARSTL